MKTQTKATLLVLSLFGICLWFFGNLYEAVVIAPNMLRNSAEKLEHWQQFFTVSNPIYFYIPVVPIAVILLLIVFLQTSTHEFQIRNKLQWSIIFLVPAILIGVYIVTQLNLALFFGDIKKVSARAHTLSLLWNILNIVRLLLLVCVLINLLHAYNSVKRSH
jgi:hypothetical protein